MYFFTPFPTSDELRSYYETEYSHVHQQQLFDLLKKNYDSGYYKNEVISIKSYLNKKDNFDEIKILDYGCGYGFFLKTAQEGGFQSYGVEYDNDVSRYNETKLGVKMIDNVHLAQVPDNSFDVIRANHIIEHLPNLEETISIFFKKLKKDGIIMLSSPCFSPDIVQSNSIYLHDLIYPEHLFYFTSKSICKLLERIGFNIEIDITQFANNEQVLRLLGINQNMINYEQFISSADFSELRTVLEKGPFFAGSNLFVVARKKGETIKADFRAKNLSKENGLKVQFFNEYFQINGDNMEGPKSYKKLEYNNNRGLYFNLIPKNDFRWNLIFPFKQEESHKEICISGNLLSLKSSNLEISLLNKKLQPLLHNRRIIENNKLNTFVFVNKCESSGDYYVCLSGNYDAEFLLYDFLLTKNVF